MVHELNCARAGLCLKRNSLSVRAGGYAYGLFLEAGQCELWRGARRVFGVWAGTLVTVAGSIDIHGEF